MLKLYKKIFDNPNTPPDIKNLIIQLDHAQSNFNISTWHIGLSFVLLTAFLALFYSQSMTKLEKLEKQNQIIIKELKCSTP